MYHVEVKGTNLDTVTEIPMRVCNSSKGDPKEALICPDFSAIGNPAIQGDASNAEVAVLEDDAVGDVGLLRRSPGEALSSYLVFGIRLAAFAQIDESVLRELRLVAFARHGAVVEHDWESDSPV